MAQHDDSSKVQPIRSDVLIAEGKTQLLERLGRDYDNMIADGMNPVCIIYAIGSEKSGVFTNWAAINEGDTEMSPLYFARALFCLTNDMHAQERAEVDSL